MKISLSLLFILFAVPFYAQQNKLNTKTTLVDKYLQSAHEAYRFNGTALVYSKGELVLHKGYGYSNFERKLLNNRETQFPILSVSKTITASVILKLQDEGRLSVNDKISKYLPDYPNGDKIKVRHLLTHSSGIYNYTNDISEEDSLISNYPLEKEFIVNHFKDKPIKFKPGKHYSYNNSGYFLLGLIIEELSDKPYETVVQEFIFAPLGMSNSGFDFQALPIEDKAQGYQYWNEGSIKPYKFYHQSFAYSAGNIYSTTADMLKWGKATLNNDILKEKTWDEAFKPRINGYAYGWQTGNYFGNRYVKHSGSYPGHMSEFICYPDEEVIIVLLNNFGNYDQNIWATGMGIASILFDLPYDNWAPRKEITLKDESKKKHIGVYRLNNKKKLEVVMEESQLYVLFDHMPNIKLHPLSENEFYFENYNTTLQFEDDVLIIREHGEDTSWEKLFL